VVADIPVKFKLDLVVADNRVPKIKNHRVPVVLASFVEGGTLDSVEVGDAFDHGSFGGPWRDGFGKDVIKVLSTIDPGVVVV